MACHGKKKKKQKTTEVQVTTRFNEKDVYEKRNKVERMSKR